jgi:hypothetical protein
MRLDFGETKLRLAAESELHSLAQGGEPGAEPATRCFQAHARVCDAYQTTAIAHRYIDVDASADLARVDAVLYGILD